MVGSITTAVYVVICFCYLTKAEARFYKSTNEIEVRLPFLCHGTLEEPSREEAITCFHASYEL